MAPIGWVERPGQLPLAVRRRGVVLRLVARGLTLETLDAVLPAWSGYRAVEGPLGQVPFDLPPRSYGVHTWRGWVTTGGLMGGSDAVGVLVADDAADIRQLVRAWSRRGGYRLVGEAADGQQAIDQAARLQPDIAVVDVKMPGVDGLAAVAGIRHASPDTRVVMFSAYPQYRTEAMTAGADVWVTKSADWRQLLDAITPHPSNHHDG